MRKESRETVNRLLSGRHPKAKKYAGSHVLVIDSEIIPLKRGAEGIKDIEKLETKYGKTPILVFVPRPDISYILCSCQE